MIAKAKTKEDIDAEFGVLLERVRGYRPEADLDLLRRAYEFASHVHEKQLRQSGEPYIAHPVAACGILADIEADETALAACLLHDTIEDCMQDEERDLKVQQARLDELQSAGKLGQAEQLGRAIKAQQEIIEKVKADYAQEMKAQFGEPIYDLVQGVTRLASVRFADLPPGSDVKSASEDMNRRLQAENLRRMVVASASDPRVLIIKLADRLHNMQTLYAKRRSKQIKIARETEVIYAKLAERLGIWRIKWEMEDLALRYLEPEKYAEIERQVARTREERMAEIDNVVARIRDAVDKTGIKVEVTGRPKHIYSIYHKMLRQGIDFDEIYDLEAIRVICAEVSECYMVLGIVHSLWPHQREHFADYISHTKNNGYQSIHTKVIVPGHGPMEVQIRTWEMHRDAEYGVAAHWRYKNDGAIDEGFAKRLTQLRHFFEMAREAEPRPGEEDTQASDEFLREVEATLWDEEIFVNTPRGDVIGLPKGATVVDFAYRIHTDIGHTCVGGKVGRRMQPLSHELKNGDTVEVLCQKNTGPSRDWLKFVKTSTARARIKAYLRRQESASLLQSGQDMLAAEAERQKVDLKDYLRRDLALPAAHRRRAPDQPVEDVMTRVAQRRSLLSREALLTAVGDHLVSAASVLHQIQGDIDEAERAAGISQEVETIAVRPSRETAEQGRLSVAGADNVMFRRGKCCQPLPGDEIIGYLTRSTGIAIHRAECANARHLREREPERIIPINWQATEHAFYHVPIEIRAHDRMGLLRDLTGLMSEVGVNITEANTLSAPITAGGDHIAAIRLQLEFINRAQLDDLLRRLPALGVVKVSLRGQVYYDSEKSDPLRAAVPTSPKRGRGAAAS